MLNLVNFSFVVHLLHSLVLAECAPSVAASRVAAPCEYLELGSKSVATFATSVIVHVT